MSKESLPPVTPTTWSARLVDWFLHNIQVTFLLFLIVIVGGIASLASLRSEGFPSPSLNLAVISGVYIGASPQEIETQIVKPIETSILGVKGVTDVNSTASNSVGIIQVSFDASTDFTSALTEVRNKVQDTTLPKDAEKPAIIVPDIGGNVSYYAITSKTLSASDLRQQGETVARELEPIDGVASFKLTQAIQDRAEIAWHPVAAGALGLTPTQITQALQAANVTIPAGTITLDSTKASVVTIAPFTSLDQLKNVAVGVDTSSTPPRAILLSQVADVALKSANDAVADTIGIRENGTVSQPAALVYALKYTSDADVIATDKLVQAKLDSLKLPSAQVVSVSNVAKSTSDQVNEIKKGAIGGAIGTGPLKDLGYLLGAIWLIALAMVLFVSWRAALLAASAIPLSLLVTFMALKIQGVSLNTLTLFSMVLVLALIVDPAIVLLEAIQRQLDMGRRGRNAVIAAMNTIGVGAFIAVVCNVLVFVPFGVVSGIFGEIIKYIPITVIPALLASYFVPLIFLTYAARGFLRPKNKHFDEEEIGNLWKTSQWFIKTNTRILQTPWMQGVIIVLAVFVPLGVAGSLFATKKVVPVQFSSTSDTPNITLTVEYPTNLTLDAKRELVNKAETVLAKNAAIESYFSMLQQDNSTELLATLIPRADRDADSTDLVKSMNKELASVQDPSHRIFMTAATENVGTPATDPVSINIFGDNLDALKKAAIKTGDILRAQPNVTRVNDGFTDENNPQIAVVIDREKLSRTGLPPVQVAGTLAAIMGESDVSKYEQQIDGTDRTVNVVLLNADRPTTVEGVANSVITANGGTIVRVSDIATVSATQGFSGIKRLNGSRFVTVSAQVKDALADAAAPTKAVKDFWTSDNLTSFGLRADALSDRGSGDQFLRSFKDLFIALAVACVILYAVLVIFFRSFSQPFIILFAVPLSFIGVFPGLAAVGGQFGFLEILGIITLTGIAVNVGIFLIDMANQRRVEGMDYRQAIAEASGIRFRPIFLTKVTALGGLLPLILLSPFWRSLAMVVLCGVLVSGVLSLFTTPILYCWFIALKARIKRGYEKRFGN
jgi:hydrophobic/amphiphilic exporter-1 (mainly G- bacteria), HAE1 family